METHSPETPLRAVLFDVDGTLIDTGELIADALDHACRVHLGRSHPRETYYALIGKPALVQMELLGGRAPAETEAMMATAVAYYEAHADREQPFPGALETLARLKAAGLKLALVTSKVRMELEPVLKRVPLDRHIDAAVTADMTARPKPYPDPVLHALRLLDVAPEAALFVGDSPYDLQSGRAAGVRTGAALWGPHAEAVLRAERPDHCFRDFAGLLAACGVADRPAPLRAAARE